MIIHEILKEQMLSEIAMNPSALAKAVRGINAVAGMEFELYIPEVGNIDDEDGDFDYDQHDEQVDNFYHIRHFFEEGDHNARRDVDSMVERLEDMYREGFVYEKMSDEFADRAHEIVKEHIEYNMSWGEVISDYLDQIEEVFDENELEWNDDWDSDKIESMIDEHNLEDEIYEKCAENAIDEYDRNFESARDNWEQDNYDEIYSDDNNQREWLRSEGLGWMSDVHQNYGYENDVYWPYMGSGDGAQNLEDLADEFSQVVGKHTNFSTSYHGGERNPGEYTIEPDGSLTDKNDYDDAGLEFISPPLPLAEMIEDLDNIVAWAKQKGVYTNKTTGLHMNISIPNYSRENLDFVKLVLLMGDEHVLQQFNRVNAYYAKSMYQEVEQAIANKDYQLEAIFDKMKKNLDKEASKMIHSGGTAKFSSVNVKNTHVEFRGPGNDWLNGDIDLVKNTLMRFAVALDAACDPEKHKQEYLKKLYKLSAKIADKDKVDITQAFAKYATGDLDKAGLKQMISQRIMNTRDRKAKQAGAEANAAMEGIADKIGSLYNELTAYDYGSGDTLSTQFEGDLRKIADAFQSNGEVKKRLEELLDRIEVKDSVQSWDASKVLLQWLRNKYEKV